ncbi:uncharacterized protein LOC141693100 [Apium graveolens]|uniref:uncharacterized protein LOC141693100 n=1 Tax=Apium graveolens TaxID=4045 RepID=UPI003D79778B
MADAKDYVQRYDRCQKHAPVVRRPPEMLTSINTPIPFVMWGMDILGPFPMDTAQRKYEIPHILVTDNGTQFNNKEFKKYCDENEIKLQFAFVTHPQANGQAEVANRIILDGLKKRIEKSRSNWVDEILPILWAYRTTYRVTTGATPFTLAYGAEAVVLVEISHSPPRIRAYIMKENDE